MDSIDESKVELGKGFSENILKCCDLCNHNEFTIKINSTTYHADIMKCNNCGLYFQNPQKEIRYESDSAHFRKYLQHEEGRRLTAQWRLKQIEKHIQPGKLLEIGCCGGLLLDEARTRGWDVIGTEITVEAINYAKNQLDLNIIDSADLSSINSNSKFDIVILFDVLEHLNYPSQVIRYIHDNLLRRGGLIAIEIPNIHTLYSRILRHLNVPNTHLMFRHYYYYSKGTFSKFANKHNFDIIDCKYGHRVYPLEHAFDRLLKRNEKIQQTAINILKRFRLGHIYVNAALHEFLFYICKKG